MRAERNIGYLDYGTPPDQTTPAAMIARALSVAAEMPDTPLNCGFGIEYPVTERYAAVSYPGEVMAVPEPKVPASDYPNYPA